MENDSISSSSSESKLPLIVGIVGFALGAAGLVLALKAKASAEAATAAIVDVRKTVDEVSGKLDGKANVADVTAISADVGKIIENQNKQTKAFNDALAAFEALQAAAKAKAVAPTTGGAGSKAVVAGPGSYAVQKGDTLSGIAKKAGISLKALQDLNPSVNPNKMQIGQLLKTK